MSMVEFVYCTANTSIFIGYI